MTPPVATAILPARYALRDGQRVEVEPAQPCPELLTEREAIRYLRLDTTGVKSPEDSIRRYRDGNKLRGTQVGRCIFYRRVELDTFLEKQTQENPR